MKNLLQNFETNFSVFYPLFFFDQRLLCLGSPTEGDSLQQQNKNNNEGGISSEDMSNNNSFYIQDVLSIKSYLLQLQKLLEAQQQNQHNTELLTGIQSDNQVKLTCLCIIF